MNEYIESIQDLESSTSSIRLGIIRNLRLKIQHGLPLPSDSNQLSLLIAKLKPRLTDASPEVIVQILLFLSDMIVYFSHESDTEQALEPALLGILPQLINLLGYSQSTVRKTASETHKCYLRHVKNPGPFITCLIKYGIENEEWRTRREALIAFNTLITPEIGEFDSSHVVTALISRLRDVSEIVVQHAVNSLSHLKNLIGEDVLLGYVRKLSNISRQLFRQYQALIIQDKNSKLPAPLRKNLPISEINISMPGYTSQVKLSDASKVSDSQSFSASQNIVFGYVPEELIEHIKNNSDYKIRSQSIEKLHQITQAITDPSVLKKDIKGLLEYLVSFLNDSNFKITLTSIYIIGQIIDISGLEIVHQLAYICSHLIAKLSDNKAIIRQAAIKIIIKLMRNIEAPSVLEICLASMGDTNPRIREEVINLTSVALLTFTNTEFNYRMIIKSLAPSLKDAKPKVKFVAMETFAIMTQFISSEQLILLLEEVGLDDESRELLNLRFKDPILPYLNSEGILIHTISRSNNQTPAPSPMNRDGSKMFVPKISSKSSVFAKSFLEPNRPLSELGTVSTDGKDVSDAILEAKLSTVRLSNESINGTDLSQSEIKRNRSFSESKAAQKEPPNSELSKQNSKHFSIYAPDFRVKSSSKLQSSMDQEINSDSPFASTSKLRRTPPPETVQENDGIADKINVYRNDIMDLNDSKKSVETPKSDGAARIAKTLSAPPVRMRALEDNESSSLDSIDPSPTRAKTSTSKSPKLSLASRRRMDAKNAQSIEQTAAVKEREKEQKLKNQIEQDYRDAVQLIRANAEWNEISGALLTVQKVIKVRPDLILESLHDITLSLIGQVHNLRSSVAKIAIACFNDMFIKFKKLMDTDLDLTANAILKKIGESGFLVDEAIKCLSSMIENVTNTRMIQVLINNSDHKNAAIRLRVSLLLENAITSLSDILGSKYVSSLRDMEKLLPILVKFLREGLAESRNAAKRSIYFLSKFPDFDKAVLKTLSSSQIRELKEAIDFVRNKAETSEEPAARDDYNLEIALEPLSKPKTKIPPSKITKENKSDENESIYAEISSVDWKRRSQAIDNISKVILHSPRDFRDRQTVQKLFDVLLARCRDGNSKVTTIALESLTKIIPVLGSSLDPVLNLLIPVITAQIISSTPNIRRLSGEVMDKLIEFSDALLIIQSLTNIAQFGNNPKLKPLIVEKLCFIVSSYYATKPAPIIKYIIPVSLKILKESRPELRNINDKLLQSLKNQMGSTLLTHTGSQTNLVRERLSALDRA